ncbi:MAG: hypothetical protein WHS82_00590 [Candidatus Methanosuratincola sp.]
MRAIDHVRKEGKLIPMTKEGERHFLKVFERGSEFSADVWVFDAYPGERFKGIPVRLNHLSTTAPSFRELIEFYRRMGFKVMHPYHKRPAWLEKNDLEERINALYRGLGMRI